MSEAIAKNEELDEATADSVKFLYNPKEVQSDRGITVSTFEHFGVQTNNDVHVYPFKDKDNNLLVCQIRYLDNKRFDFDRHGVKPSRLLWGSHLFPKGSAKNILITEGMLDAMSAYQMMTGRVPCVSLPNGAESVSKALENNFEYLDSFENIYVCFDNDDPGRAATQKVARMFKTGKVRIIEFPSEAKDANDVLFKMKEPALFTRLFNNAKAWTPSGIVLGSSLLDKVLHRARTPSVPYPWDGLNDYLGGIRPQELITLCAGTGQGKSSILRELAFYLKQNTNDKIGLMFLEEDTGKTAEGLLSIALGKPIHLKRNEIPEEDIVKVFKEVFDNEDERFVLYDHFGSTDIDDLTNRVRYMAAGVGAKYIFLDHISIVVSSQENGDERKAIDSVMTKLRQLVQETGVTLFLVTHLKRSDAAHEEGNEVSLNELRGSQSIAQLSDTVLGLERNQQDPNVDKRNTTLVRVLKSRETGLTGPCAALRYSRDTGRIFEVDLDEYYGKSPSEDESEQSKQSSGFTKLKD